MKTLITSLRMLGVMTLLTGVVYPLVVTGLGWLVAWRASMGSLVEREGRPVGSELLAQRFVSDRYFWPRPSACDDGVGYATVPSSASNLGPCSSNLVALARERAGRFRAAHGWAAGAGVPSEMLFASGSGLDPHISPESARLQISRVARAREYDEAKTARLRQWVEQCIEPPQWGILGEPRVNVLRVNMALDAL